MMSVKVGDLMLDQSEYRTYVIVQEAVKTALQPYERRMGSVEECLHGKDQGGGLITTVKRNKDKIDFHTKMLYSLYGVLGTTVIGVTISIITYILTVVI